MKNTSNKPFKNKPNIRSGTGPVYITFKTQPFNKKSDKNVDLINKTTKFDCIGPYDNVVNYVYEIDLSKGDKFGYVDCDYVD